MPRNMSDGWIKRPSFAAIIANYSMKPALCQLWRLFNMIDNKHPGFSSNRLWAKLGGKAVLGRQYCRFQLDQPAFAR